MTTTVTINAHPAPPCNVVEVTIADASGAVPQTSMTKPGETAVFHIHGNQTLTAGEAETDLLPANEGA